METQQRRKPYPTDLKDREWKKIEHLVPQPKSGGRPAKYERREILNALFYMTKSGVLGECCLMTYLLGSGVHVLRTMA
jgi:transposase